MAVIMELGLFHLKRNVGAFIHVRSWFKIEGQFLLKNTHHINNVKLLCTRVLA